MPQNLKISWEDSITGVVATGVVVVLVVNLAVFFINDGSKGSCTAGKQKARGCIKKVCSANCHLTIRDVHGIS